jgi:hypothetical protein
MSYTIYKIESNPTHVAALDPQVISKFHRPKPVQTYFFNLANRIQLIHWTLYRVLIF